MTGSGVRSASILNNAAARMSDFLIISVVFLSQYVFKNT
jgi:hypothetical protein